MIHTAASFFSAAMRCKQLAADRRCLFYQALITHQVHRVQFAAPDDSPGDIGLCAGRCNERLVQSQRRHAQQTDCTLAANKCIPANSAGAIAASASDFPI